MLSEDARTASVTHNEKNPAQSKPGPSSRFALQLSRLVDDNAGPGSRRSLHRSLHGRVIAVTVVIRTGAFGPFRTHRHDRCRADSTNTHFKTLSLVPPRRILTANA